MRIFRQDKFWDAFLGDDGTLDTLIIIKANGHTKEIRFDGEYAAQYRDKKTGAMSARGVKELAEEAIDEMELEDWQEFWPNKCPKCQSLLEEAGVSWVCLNCGWQPEAPKNPRKSHGKGKKERGGFPILPRKRKMTEADYRAGTVEIARREAEGPEQGDYIIQPSGKVAQYGKLLSHIFSNEIKQHMDFNQYWPDVWSLDDHGGLMLLAWDEEENDYGDAKYVLRKAYTGNPCNPKQHPLYKKPICKCPRVETKEMLHFRCDACRAWVLGTPYTCLDHDIMLCPKCAAQENPIDPDFTVPDPSRLKKGECLHCGHERKWHTGGKCRAKGKDIWKGQEVEWLCGVVPHTFKAGPNNPCNPVYLTYATRQAAELKAREIAQMFPGPVPQIERAGEGFRVLINPLAVAVMKDKVPGLGIFYRGIATDGATQADARADLRRIAKSYTKDKLGKMVSPPAAGEHFAASSYLANPKRTLVGRKVTRIETTSGIWAGPSGGAVYGIEGGSVLITGFFSKVPGGTVRALEYMDEGKAKREGLKTPNLPWRHDFSKERVTLERVKGGLLMRAKSRPLWAVQ